MSLTDELPPQIQALEVAHVIALSVLDDMRLIIEPSEIARDAEHNSATFRIVRQPASLDTYVCRAEVETTQGTNHRLVTGGEFSLTSDIAVQGIGQLQLVYSDGTDKIVKTYKAPFHVSGSVNAVDESEPEFENGLGQITRAAFANAVGDDTGIQFYNIANQPLDFVAWPPGSGEGLDEARADTLYLRLNGMNAMQGSVGIQGPNRGITWGDSSVQGALYSTGSQLVMRLPLGDPPFVLEPNSGASAQRTAVITEQSGDQRYVQPVALDPYLLKSGGQMTGPLITQNGSSNTNPGIGIGENSSGFWRSSLYLICTIGGQTAWQSSNTEMMLGVRLNAATQQITNLGAPTAAGDAANRSYVDNAVAGVPRPVVPVSRVFIPNEITISTAVQIFFDQPFFTSDNAQRTILVTFYPQFDAGTPSAFYDLEYTCSIAPLVVERIAVYPTANSYMGGGAPIAFAATVTPASGQIPVQLTVRAFVAGTTALVQIGSRATQRSYVLIQEMTQ